MGEGGAVAVADEAEVVDVAVGGFGGVVVVGLDGAVGVGVGGGGEHAFRSHNWILRARTCTQLWHRAVGGHRQIILAKRQNK